MTLIGTLLRMFGAAILLIAVQFASVAAEAHVGHGHTPDSHHLQGHSHQGHGHDAAEGTAHAVSSGETAPVNPAVQTQPAAEAEAAVQNGPGAPASVSDACVIGCCGSAGCCGAALVEISPDLPPKACALRMGFARLIFVREVDPQGLRKPPRLFA
ncbi:hypothetical protein [Afipia massiliensis]|uniref:hypothetical protein n=1 Tax=Afipia massiliensis TaxID=211460 RepID=UPI001AEDE263|nr:hypothetical protein [Afipia massiliensis]